MTKETLLSKEIVGAEQTEPDPRAREYYSRINETFQKKLHGAETFTEYAKETGMDISEEGLETLGLLTRSFYTKAHRRKIKEARNYVISTASPLNTQSMFELAEKVLTHSVWKPGGPLEEEDKNLVRTLFSNERFLEYFAEHWDLFISYSHRYPEVAERILGERNTIVSFLEKLSSGEVSLLFSRSDSYPKALSRLVRDQTLPAKIIDKIMLPFLAYSYNYPGTAEEALRNPVFRDIAASRWPQFMLQDSHNYPGAMEDVLHSPLSGFLARNHDVALARFSCNYPEAYEDLKKRFPHLHTSAEVHEAPGQYKEMAEFPFPPPNPYFLLRDGFATQDLIATPSDFQRFQGGVEKAFGITIDPEASVSYGIEVEPDIAGEVDTEGEYRSFAVTSSGSLAKLVEEYAKELSHLTKMPEQLHGEMMGTLHLNIAVSQKEYTPLIHSLKKFREIAGLIVSSSVGAPRLRKNLESKYLAAGGLANIFFVPDFARLAPGSTKQVMRLEIKGFELARDKKMRRVMIQGFDVLAEIMENPQILEKLEPGDELLRMREELMRLVQIESEKEEELMTLTPRNRTLSQYREMVRGFEETAEGFEEKMLQKIQALERSPQLTEAETKEQKLRALLKDEEATLTGRMSQDLAERYRRGEDISRILKNLGLGAAQERIQSLQKALEDNRLNKLALPEWVDLERAKNWSKEFLTLRRHASEAIAHIRDLRLSIGNSRKKAAALQESMLAAVGRQVREAQSSLP